MAYISKITPLGQSESYDLKAAKLVTARSLKTKLDSTTAITFDGSADQNAIPVTGTLPIANGGTSATTAGAAANNLLLGLPTWTANPTDDTYFIRRDTSGGDAFGQVKASTIYNYIQGKADTRYVLKAGDTMTGALKLVSGSGVYNEGNSMFYWLSGSTSSYQKQAAIFTTASTVNSKKVCERLYFREYSYNSSTGATIEQWDQYRLPTVTANKTGADTYEILTSKSAVTIAQGGTGATTAAGARANLGTWSLVSDTYNTLMPADGTTNAWVKIGKANTSYGLLPSQSGEAGSGHNYLGTSSWYWKYAYIDEIHGTLKGNADTATLPLGFSSRSTNAAWGNTTGTTVTAWNDSSGGSIDFRKDNPSSGKLSIKVDGRFYGNEGTYPAMLMNYNNGYWGLGSDPDGGYSGWVRAPASGILTSAKNASTVGSGVGAIGAIEWRFAHVYADTLHGNAETATKANGLVDGTSTMTSAYNKAGLAYGDYTWLAGWNGYELRAVAKTQFAQASHTHSYLPLSGGTLTGNLTAPVYLCNAGSWQKIELIHADSNAQSAGWYRTCVVAARHDYADFLLSLTGGWNNGAPSVALLHICMRNGQAKIATLHNGFTGRITQVRLVKNATNTAYLDLYLSATSSATAALCGNFLGNVAVSNVATTNTITTSTENVLDTVNLSSYNFQINGTGKFTSVYGAVWNDYAEYRITKDTIESGRCVIETGNDDLVLSTARLQPGAEIVSDTFGFAIGETDEAKTPIATTGRVLAYIYEGREAARVAIGKPVCSGPDGTVSIMTDEEYQKYGYCAIGTISAIPDYEEWGTGNIKVNNRIWIRIR